MDSIFSRPKTFLGALPLFFRQLKKVFGLLTFSSLLLSCVPEVTYAQNRNDYDCHGLNNGTACYNRGTINNIYYPSTEPRTHINVKSRLIGTWKASGVEFGQSYEFFWVIKPDGTEFITFKSINGSQRNRSGHWQYSNGIITEEMQGGKIGKGSVEFINPDYFVLTILDNAGHGLYTGLKRHYYRYNQ